MPAYAYRAKRGPKEILTGRLEAATTEDAVEQLTAMGLVPVSLEEEKASAAPARADRPPVRAASEPVPAPGPGGKGRIRSQEVTVFGRQLSSLLRAGVPILRALWILSEQSQNPALKRFLAQAQDEIKEGRPLSSVLARSPKMFPPIYVALVRAGEDSGTLQETLLRVSEYRQRQEEVFSKIRTAMAYPILMGLTGVGTIVFMLTYVIPRLTQLFSSMGENLPLPTRLLMSASSVFQQPAFWLAVAALVLAGAAFARLRPGVVAAAWSRLSLGLPVVGDFVMKAEMARLARTLELLVRSGIPILRTLEIAAPVLGNGVLRGEFAKMQALLAGGGSLGRSLRDNGRFPLFFTNLISVGEESGRLEEALSEIAAFYERETDELVKVLTSLLEPLMILAMGLVVGFIVIAMLLPMFELNLAVR